MAFSSNATSEEGFYQDFLQHVVRDRIEKGLAPSGYGQNKPLPSVRSAQDVVKFLGDLSQEQISTKGGSRLDPYAAPVGDTYRARRYKFISELEGVRNTSYDDATGRPITDPASKKGLVTVGVGFNMDAPDARKIFESALPGVKFDEVYSGKRSLMNTQIERLFDASVANAESVVENVFKGTPLSEHQRLALVSLAFNNPSLIGPKLREAVKSGNTKAAVDEILHNSNKGNIRGLGSRRWREAFVFSGSDQAKSILPDYSSYMSKYA